MEFLAPLSQGASDEEIAAALLQVTLTIDRVARPGSPFRPWAQEQRPELHRWLVDGAEPGPSADPKPEPNRRPLLVLLRGGRRPH